MSILVIDPTTALAIRAAMDGPNGTREVGVITAAMAPFASGNITVEVLDGAGTLLHATVRGAWTSDTAGAVKRMLASTVVSQTNHANGVPATARIKTTGGTVIFQMSAGLANDDLTFLAPIDIDVRVDSGPLVLTAPEGLDTVVDPPSGDTSLFIDSTTMAELVSRVAANDPSWVAMRTWCNANMGAEWVGNFAGYAETTALANYAMAWMLGSRAGEPNALTWGNEAMRIWNSEPRFTSVHGFFGPRHRRKNVWACILGTSPAPSGTFPRGATIRGRTSGTTAEIVCVTYPSPSTPPGAFAALKNFSGAFTANEVCEVVGDTSSTFVFASRSRLLALADSGYGSRYFYTLYGAMYYWMDGHPGLTEAVKQEVRDIVKDIWDDFNGASDGGAHAKTVGIGNYQFGHMTQEVVFGIILRDTYPNYYTEAVRRFKLRTDFLRDNVYSSGWLPEGGVYGPGMCKELAYSVLALKTMTTELHTDYDAFTRNVPFAMYMGYANAASSPWFLDDGYVGSSSSQAGSESLAAYQRLYGRGSVQSRAIARIFARKPPAFHTSNQPHIYHHRMLCYLADESTSTTDMPLSTGRHYFMAKASHELGATSVWVSAGPYYNDMGYQRRDQGSLRIARTKPLLLTADYNNKYVWISNRGQMHQTYTTVHGRTTTTDIQQDVYNAGYTLSGGKPELPASFLQLNAEFGPSHYEDIGHAAFYRVPYRTAFYRNREHTAGPDIDRIARSVMFVRPGLIFVFDAFRQAVGQTASYIRTNWHFPLAAGMPTTANANRDVVVVNGTSKLWGHMAYPASPATNVVELFDGMFNDDYVWQATPETTSLDQFFLHVFRAGDTTGYSAPTFVNFSGANVYGCLVSGLETAEGTQVCGAFADNGTDDPPSAFSYTVAQTGPCYHYVGGLKKNFSYAVTAALVGGNAEISIAEGAGYSVGASGMLRFLVA